jgi:hypothetical protein
MMRSEILGHPSLRTAIQYVTDGLDSQEKNGIFSEMIWTKPIQ